MSQEKTHATFPQIDSALAYGTNELNAVTLFTFLNGSNKSTDVWREIMSSQEGGFFSPVPISRQRVQDRIDSARSYGLLAPATSEQRPSDLHELTDEGLVVAAIAGHLVRDVSIPHNFNLSGIFGKARNIADVVADDYKVLSPALMRTLLLRGILHARGPIFLKYADKQLGLDVSISSHALQQHARHLARLGIITLADKKAKKQHTLPAKSLKLTDRGELLASEMENIVLKSFFIDDDHWPAFMAEGLEKAREAMRKPEFVANLLMKRDLASPEKRANAFSHTVERVKEFGNDGKQFSSGELATYLGNGYTKFTASAMVKRLVAEGILTRLDSHVPKYVRYTLAD